jgi:hypothetical protein
MKNLLKYVVLGGAITAFTGMAYAIPTLWLTDGTAANSFKIADGSALDANPLPNVVTYIGSVGSIWSVNVSTGIIGGTAAQPTLDFSSVDMSIGAGTLYAYFSADGFGPTIGSLSSAVGGTTTNGDVTFRTAVNAANVLFTGTLITTQGPFTGPAFSDLASAPVSFGAPYSLSGIAVIRHTSGGTTSFDMSTSVPDGGTTVLLLGAGLMGLTLVSRSRKRRSLSMTSLAV